jgi:hypothetical protein
VESVVESALKQIEDKQYETELRERGITNMKKLAIVFNGKDFIVKEKRNLIKFSPIAFLIHLWYSIPLYGK